MKNEGNVEARSRSGGGGGGGGLLLRWHGSGWKVVCLCGVVHVLLQQVAIVCDKSVRARRRR